MSNKQWDVTDPNIQFKISRELNVREAFAKYSHLFGYDITTSQEAYPDYELVDTEGNTVRAEVEKKASDYLNHGHHRDERKCDLIICWLDDLTDTTGLPEILELQSYIDGVYTFPEPNHYVARYSKNGSHRKGLQIEYNKRELELKLRWWKYIRGEWKNRTGRTPAITASEFKSLITDIEEVYLRRTFYNYDEGISFGNRNTFCALNEWAEKIDQRVESQGDGVNIAEHISSDGSVKKVLRLKIPSDGTNHNLAFDRYDWKGHWHYASKGSACVTPGELVGLLEQIDPEVRESSFIDGELDSLKKLYENETGLKIK